MPEYHRKVPNVLSAVAVIGLVFIILGVLMFDLWPTLFGTLMAYMGKLWFAGPDGLDLAGYAGKLTGIPELADSRHE